MKNNFYIKFTAPWFTDTKYIIYEINPNNNTERVLYDSGEKIEADWIPIEPEAPTIKAYTKFYKELWRATNEKHNGKFTKIKDYNQLVLELL